MSVQRVPAMTSRAGLWLRGDLGDLVQVVPRQSVRTVPDATELDVVAGLERWAGRMTRRRAEGVCRRYLLVGVVVALVPALVILLAGGSQPFWVLAILVLGPLAAAVALTQRVSAARAARVLDRALGLHEQLGTAVELHTRSGPNTGLAAMVLDDASATLAHSFSSARVRPRRAVAEWLWLTAALCALVALIAAPRGSAGAGLAHGGSASARAPVGGASGAQRPGKATPAHTTTASASVTTSTPAVQQVPLTGGAKAAYGVQASRTTGSRAPVDVNGSATVQGQHTKPGLSVSGGKGNGAAQSAAGQAAAAAGGKTGGASASSKAGAASSGHASKAASSGATGAHAGVTSTTAGKTAGASRASQGQGHGGTPAAGSAGAGKAAAHAQLGLAPYGGASTGKRGLPLQATYTPSGSTHVSSSQGVSQNTNGGGGGRGQSGHPGGGAAQSAGSGTNFSVIPPTANGSASSDQDLLQNYFGAANQLTFKGW